MFISSLVDGVSSLWGQCIKNWKVSLVFGCRDVGGERKQQRLFECNSWALEKMTSRRARARGGEEKDERGGKEHEEVVVMLFVLPLIYKKNKNAAVVARWAHTAQDVHRSSHGAWQKKIQIKSTSQLFKVQTRLQTLIPVSSTGLSSSALHFTSLLICHILPFITVKSQTLLKRKHVFSVK